MTTIKKTSVGEDMEKSELSYISGWDVIWYSHYRKQFGSYLKVKYSYYKTQRFHSYIYTQ